MVKIIGSNGHRAPGESLRVKLVSDLPGVVEVPGGSDARVSIHVGPSTRQTCWHGDESHRGTAIHGDIDIIPAGMPSRWELQEKDAALVLSLAPELLHAAAEERGLDASRLEMRNRFQARDAQLEHIGWALKTEMERGYPCGRLYLDSLAMALAVHLVQNYSSLACPTFYVNGKMPAGKLKQVLLFIEDNLSEDLSLADVAEVAGLSVSHCKTLFRASVGLSIHQYVIRRRVERAASLLQESNLSISQVALETGFAHQSHLAMHMRRLLGTSPKMMLKTNLQ
jgi:AraC family transcriptional regulator